MAPSRAIAPPLTDVLYIMAEEGADEETSDLSEDMWAGLMRDGADVARRVEEEIEAGDAPVGREDVDPEDLTAIRDAAGVIVTRDHRHGRVSAETFPDENELLAAWNALVVELEPSALDVEEAEMDDSTEGPSSGPKATDS
ncbi:MAG TPA: hypothetical protein VKW09_15975 [bacterium]|nr:hypothetical protein [bacterium]